MLDVDFDLVEGLNFLPQLLVGCEYWKKYLFIVVGCQI